MRPLVEESEVLIRDWCALCCALQCALLQMDNRYLRVARYAEENPVYRERAYCYELYHRLRCLLPEEKFAYTLHGEIDKSGHKVVHDAFGYYPNPDFVVHAPGAIGDNLAVIEVKPWTFSESAGRRDVGKLRTFIEARRLHYHFGVFLVFGSEAVGGSIPCRINRLGIGRSRDHQHADERMLVIWHKAVGECDILRGACVERVGLP